jgi:phosphatidylserine/phosphatidylglycerophosphate/cardiolipin synthase-like enzyme
MRIPVWLVVTVAELALAAMAEPALVATSLFEYPETFRQDNGIPAEFSDPDWTQGVNKARSLYEGFLLEGKPIDRGVVALNYVTTDKNNVALKVGVDESWRAIRGAITDARQSIDITMIGWQVDELVPFHKAETFGFDLIDQLCEAARRGVSVNVAVNDMWFKQKAWYLTGGFDRHFDNAVSSGRCQDAHGKKLRYVRGIAWHHGLEPIGRYDHRKVWIFDGEVAFIGGYTVSDEMRDNMYDLEWELRGPAVAQLQANFMLAVGYQKAPLADFASCAASLAKAPCRGLTASQVRTVMDAYFPQHSFAEEGYATDITIVQNNPLLPGDGPLGATRLYHELVSGARDHLQLASPFFTSDEIYSRVADSYRQSGCALKVDVLFPERPEHMLVWGKKARQKLRHLVAQAEETKRGVCGGVGEDVVIKAFRGDGQCSANGKRGRLHGKVLLTDDYVTVGSTNFDGVSLHRDLELNVVSSDKTLIRAVSERFFRVGGDDECGHTLMFKPDAEEPVLSQALAQRMRELP